MQRVILSLFIFSVMSVFADFHSALSFYEKGDYESAYNEFYDMASMGEQRSQFNLGVMYYQGQYVSKDINKAYAWMKLATDSITAKEHEKKMFQLVAKQANTKEGDAIYIKLKQQFGMNALMTKLYPVIRPSKKSSQATPIYIKEPRYPKRAAMKGIEGFTQFKFDLDESGKPRNIVLVDSFPPDTFDRNSLMAIKNWRFEPVKNEVGEPIYSKDLSYTLTFLLSGGEGQKEEVVISLDNPLLSFKSLELPDFPERIKNQVASTSYPVEITVNFDIDSSGKPLNVVIDGDERHGKEVMAVIDEWRVSTNKAQSDLRASVIFVQESKISLKPKASIFNNIKQAALNDDPNAQLKYGLMLERFPILEEAGRQNEWYLRSAIKGNNAAQYLLGKNLIKGKGCVADKAKGIEWLTRAASSGQAEARAILGEMFIQNNDLKSHLKAKEYLEYAANNTDKQQVKLQLAKLLLTSPYNEVRKPEVALELVDSINWDQVGDDITEYELKAKAYAAIGEFEEAVEYQEEALEEAEDGDFYSEGIRQQLLAYQAKLKSR